MDVFGSQLTTYFSGRKPLAKSNPLRKEVATVIARAAIGRMWSLQNYMDRSDITELYFITSIVNVLSIMEHGILSNKLSQRLPHDSVAEPGVQERRKSKLIPGARPLHEYANLYFDAHNPMLSKLRGQNDKICVLRVAPEVLDFPNVIIADRNAASNWASFFPVADGLKVIRRERVFDRYWTHQEDLSDECLHKAEKCAEVIVPDRVEARFIMGAYVANASALERFQQLGTALSVCIKSDMFF